MEIKFHINNKLNAIYTSTSTAYIWGKNNFQNDTEINNNIPVSENNWAFLDMQNLHKGVQEKGWRINWKLFRDYLEREHHVTKAVVFLGYLKNHTGFYNCLQRAGFILEFRTVTMLESGKIDGGNIDADLASYVMDYKNDYSKAIIIADDGDYYRTIKSLNEQNKLKLIISSHSFHKTSYLIKRIASDLILSIDRLRHTIELKENKS
jgi:hypothetical protein